VASVSTIDELNARFYQLGVDHAAAVRQVMQEAVNDLKSIRGIKITLYGTHAVVQYAFKGRLHKRELLGMLADINREQIGLIEVCAHHLAHMGAFPTTIVTIEKPAEAL
jgi:hypothetical protein